MKMPQPPQNVLSRADVRALAALGDFDAVKDETRVLSPARLFGLGRLVNRFLAPLPLIASLCLRHFTVCRSLRRSAEVRSATVVIPARNERGNIEAAVKRIPRFAQALEIIFVEGGSRSEEHTSELQSLRHLVCRLLLEKKKTQLLQLSR